MVFENSKHESVMLNDFIKEGTKRIFCNNYETEKQKEMFTIKEFKTS